MQSLVAGQTFQHSIQKLENEIYYLCRKCVSWSILHGGPEFPVLCVGVFQYIAHGGVGKPNAVVENMASKKEKR